MFANEPAKEMYGWPLHFLAKYLVWSADYYDCRFGKQTFYFSKIYYRKTYTLDKMYKNKV